MQLKNLNIVAVDEAHFAVSPAQFLGDVPWTRYTNLTRGMHYDRENRRSIAPFRELPAFVDAVVKSNFGVLVDEGVKSALAARAAELETEADAADAKAREAAQEIAARGLRLYPFQEDGARWLRERVAHGKNALLADQMGLGKTIQALAALPDKAAAIVVCPASLKLNWRAEIRRWRPDLDPRVINGKRTFYTPTAGQVVIVNYDVLLDEPGALAYEPGTFLIVDEAHLVKNRQAARSKRVRALRETLDERGGRTWFLTGTPLLNYPMELWSVLDALGVAKEAFTNRETFRRAYHAVSNVWGGTDYGKTNEADRSLISQSLRRVSLMRLRQQVLPELPAKIRTDVPVEIDSATERMLDDTLRRLEELGVDLAESVSFAEACRGTGGGENNRVAFELISKARAALATAKIPAVLAMVEQYEEAGEPLVFFSCHLAPVEAVADREGWAKITGETSVEARAKIVERFQAGELKGLALTVAAGGVGLTLTKAANVLFADLAWTPALNSQAEDRVCRIGQTRGVQVTRLVADHALDRRLTELLTLKEEHVATVERSAVAAVTASGSVAKRAAASALREMIKELPAGVSVAPTAAATEPTAPAAATAAADGKRIVQVVTNEGRVLTCAVRPPANEVERHAGPALVTLAGLSPDGASVRNDQGFSKVDLEFGLSLAKTFQEFGALSDRQWIFACKIVRKYHRQVGAAPAECA